MLLKFGEAMKRELIARLRNRNQNKRNLIEEENLIPVEVVYLNVLESE